jgi:hypothetical protein
MISERQLARGFAAKWREWAPCLNASFLIEVGAAEGKWARFCRIWDEPLAGRGTQRWNDLIAEIAFGLFSECLVGERSLTALCRSTHAIICQRAAARIAVMRRTQHNLESQLNDGNLEEATALANRLLKHFSDWSGAAEIQPLLPGVGLLNSCHPDLIYGDTLVEIKMGNSGFRSDDIRQLLVYYCLWRECSPSRTINRLCLVNPRRGISWEFPVETLVQIISGNSVQEFVQELLDFVSGHDSLDQDEDVFFEPRGSLR